MVNFVRRALNRSPADFAVGAIAEEGLPAQPGRNWFHLPVALRLGVILLVVIFWEIGARFYNDPDFLAPASQSIAALKYVLSDFEIIAALGMMSWELAVAFAMSLVAGLMLGMLVGINRPTYLTFFPIILMVYATPQITILPLFVLMFGIGPAVKVAFGFSHGFFPIIVNVIAGTQNINPTLMKSAQSMGASKWQIYRHASGHDGNALGGYSG
ncbi:MAG: ABC transporter permease subunit [Rhodospirillales bacterium]|nr:ABC transporter permease subunit [Rhodospirillales bacterium]